MANVDGVILGNTITSILGVAMNKDWKEPDCIKNPVAFDMKRYLRNLEIHNNN